MKKIKRIFGFIFILMIFALGIYVGYDLLSKSFFIPQTVHVSSVDEVANKKLSLETAIFENFQSKIELITLEAELSEIIEWDDSWGKFGIFHKSQKIRFYGTALYITDLNLVTKYDIQVDIEQKIVTIALPKPVLKSVTINEDKTEYGSVENGWLRFGGVTLTPEQYNTVYAMVKENMQNSLENRDFYEKAEKATQDGVKKIFQPIVDLLDESYYIQTTWNTTYMEES